MVVPDGTTPPTAAQIAAGTGATWAVSSPILQVGDGESFYIPQPTELDVDSDWDVYAVEQYADLSYGTVLSASFTTLPGPPLLLSTSPSAGWLLTSLTANITMTFDQNILAGTGNIVLRDTDTSADVETFNIATGVGSAGGTVSIAGAVLTINPNASLTARKNYAITVPATAITNTAATDAYAGISNYTTFAFRAKYSTSNADVIAASETNVLAFDLSDDSCKIVNSGDAGDNYNSTWSGKVTVVGSLSAEERGMRMTNLNYATLATSLFPYSGTAGTLIVECSAQDFDTAGGTGSSGNAAIALVSSSTTGATTSHFMSLSKSDSSTRNSNLQAVSRNEAGPAKGIEIASPVGLFPKGGVYKAIGMTWDATSLIVADANYSAATNFTGPSPMPDDFTTLRFGWLVASNLYIDLRRGIYFPSKLSAAELQTRIGSFLNFVSA